MHVFTDSKVALREAVTRSSKRLSFWELLDGAEKDGCSRTSSYRLVALIVDPLSVSSGFCAIFGLIRVLTGGTDIHDPIQGIKPKRSAQ